MNSPGYLRKTQMALISVGANWALVPLQRYRDLHFDNVLETSPRQISPCPLAAFVLLKSSARISQHPQNCSEISERSPISSHSAYPSCCRISPMGISWRGRDDPIWVRDFPELEIYIANNWVCERAVIGADMFRASYFRLRVFLFLADAFFFLLSRAFWIFGELRVP